MALFSRGVKRGAPSEPFYALRDVSLRVEPGEVIGIIGRNGAGKSTLLKLLGRITRPSSGRITLYGRVGTLLEVGTGFHPELSGRENVFLSGAILGMSRAEIRSKFDEIVAFAEIEKFLDVPVKRYSSGMFVRLAFAVAAHLETEILLVDEVMAVGDVQFQKKCFGRMGEVARQGRTVLLVSHQLGAVRSLCQRTIWLSTGKVAADGPTGQVISEYLAVDAASEWSMPQGTSSVTNPYFDPVRFAVVDDKLQPVKGAVRVDDRLQILIEGELSQVDEALTVGFAVFASTGDLLFWSYHTDGDDSTWPNLRPGRNRLIADFPHHILNEGDYRVELIAGLHFKQWLCQPGVNAPAVNLSLRGGFSPSPNWIIARPGLLAPLVSYRLLD
jgi:lipopolysaccharide transport system ATP-binding protein